MAEYVVNELTKIEIPVLCVHDSFIVAYEYERLLKRIMNKAYDFAISKLIIIFENGKDNLQFS